MIDHPGSPSSYGNLQKYKNPHAVQRWLIERFLRKVSRTVRGTGATSGLDAGCGEGFVSARLHADLPDLALTCVDHDDRAIVTGKGLFPSLNFCKASAEALPYPDRSFDLVLCLEVLEHQHEPLLIAREIARVSRRYCLISVPREPWFQMGNFLRGKHLRHWGNVPDHYQHWNTKTFPAFLRSAGLTVEQEMHSFPWLLYLCRV